MVRVAACSSAVLLAMVFSSLKDGARAFPTGAGQCIEGAASPAGSHLRAGAISETLSGGGVGLLIDGVAVGDPGSSIDITVGEPHTITINAGTEGDYRGVLVRVSPTMGVSSTSGVLSIPSAFSSLLQIATNCGSTAAGVTHTSRVAKSTVDMTVTLDTVATGYPLDVNVVLRNSAAGSVFYYSQFFLNAIDASTPAPVTPMPVTSAPTTPAPSTSLRPSVIFTPTTSTAPSERPTNPLDPSLPPGFCFSGRMMVQTPNGLLEMESLRVKDQVLVDTEGTYESVYGFGHYSPDQIGTYLQIETTQDKKELLEISSAHLVFAKRQGVSVASAIPASLLKVGDALVMVAKNDKEQGEEMAIVQKIRAVQRKGLYAPFTPSGTIVVNGIVTSSYVTLQDDSNVLVLSSQEDEIKTPFTHHWLAHISQGPHRFWCTYVAHTACENYTDDGISIWVNGPLRFSEFLLKQHWLVMVVLGLPIFSFLTAWWVLEETLKGSSTGLWMMMMMTTLAAVIMSAAMLFNKTLKTKKTA